MFLSMFPDQEFLPRVPDPEDVVVEDTQTPPVEPEAEDAPIPAPDPQSVS